jgi:hypothetical protein
MIQDLRLALRAVTRTPSYAALVIGSLAIGIAAPVLAFSVLNAIFFRPLDGVGDQDGLVRIEFRNGRDRGARHRAVVDDDAARQHHPGGARGTDRPGHRPARRLTKASGSVLRVSVHGTRCPAGGRSPIDNDKIRPIIMRHAIW